MRIYRASLAVVNDAGTEVIGMDVIECEGGFWLVPSWLGNPSSGVKSPTRIISMRSIRYDRSSGCPEFVIHDPIPKRVFERRSQSPEAFGFEVQERPGLEFPIRE
jgi:hypothetical protein